MNLSDVGKGGDSQRQMPGVIANPNAELQSFALGIVGGELQQDRGNLLAIQIDRFSLKGRDCQGARAMNGHRRNRIGFLGREIERSQRIKH